jgi:hypothetical protein
MFRVAIVSAFSMTVAIGFVGCGSDGVGVDQCRTIEYARCSAGQYCDLRLGSAAMITECDHFARDNCLHGLASGREPHASDLNHCVAAIKAAGTCAHRQGSDTRATDCAALEGAFASSRTTVCDVVQDPENTSECGFLTEMPVVAPADAGSASTDAAN